MRAAILLVATLALCQSAFAASKTLKNTRVFEDLIESAIECVREDLNTGIEDYGIPSLNPLDVDDYTFDFTSWEISGLEGYLQVTDLLLTGLLDFLVSDVQGTLGLIPPRYRVEVTLRWPYTTFTTNYDVNSTYNDANVYGAGALSFAAINVAADIDLTATILGGIGLSAFELWPSLEGLNSFSITGLYNDEEYSQYVTDLILSNPSGIVAEYAQAVSDAISSALIEFVNNGGGDEEGFLATIVAQCVSS